MKSTLENQERHRDRKERVQREKELRNAINIKLCLIIYWQHTEYTAFQGMEI